MDRLPATIRIPGETVAARMYQALAGLALALAWSGAAAQVCCPAGCSQDGNGCVTNGATRTTCARVACPPPPPPPPAPGGNGGHPGGQPAMGNSGGLACYVDQPPRGTWSKSCQFVSWDCKSLKANCLTRSGKRVSSLLPDAPRCVGDIANMDGKLRCSTGSLPPNGSYKQSCMDIVMTGSDLSAKCKRGNGQWADTSHLAVSTCRNGIDNIDGTLRCH